MILLWTLSTVCNLRCRYCYYKQEDRGYSSKLNFQRAYENLVKVSPSIIYLSGEPTMIDNIKDVIEKIKKILPNSKIIFTTNGVLLTDQLVNSIINNVDMFLISLDGNDDITHNIFRSNFNDVVSNIQRLNVYRDKNTTLLGTNTVVHKKNLHKINDMINFFTTDLLVDYMHFQPLYWEGSNDCLNDKDLLTMTNTLYRYRANGDRMCKFTSDIYINSLRNYALDKSFGVKCENGNTVYFMDENQNIAICPSPSIRLRNQCEETINCINMIEISRSFAIFDESL